MTILQTIHHKKNELFEVEFFKGEECTEAFDFKNAKNLYIQPFNGDCTPIFALSHKLSGLNIKAIIFTPIWHLGWYDGISPQTPVVNLNDVLCDDELKNVNLSKYIPEDNTVLFFTQEDTLKYSEIFKDRTCAMFNKIVLETIKEKNTKKLTIFLPHGTKSGLQKAEEVAKELKEKYGVEEVNFFALHCFVQLEFHSSMNMHGDNLFSYGFVDVFSTKNPIIRNINKIIATNSIGILPVQDNERLQVIDAKEIFEEYLKENNLI